MLTNGSWQAEFESSLELPIFVHSAESVCPHLSPLVKSFVLGPFGPLWRLTKHAQFSHSSPSASAVGAVKYDLWVKSHFLQHATTS